MAKTRKDHKGRVLRKGEIQRKSDLMYIYAYTDSFTHKRKYIYSKDLQILREKVKKLQCDLWSGLDVYAARSMELNDAFDRYISTKTELRPRTYANYIYMYNYYIRETFGKNKVADIKFSDVLRFYMRLHEDISLNTLKVIHTILHPTFQMLVRDEIIRINPCDDVIAEMTKKTEKQQNERHALTVEQQKAFMNYVSKSPFFCHWLPFFTVLLGTGCRIGEVLGLRWSDIDFETGTIHINHTTAYGSTKTDGWKYEFHITKPKTTAGIRSIPMMDEVRKAFREEEKRQKEEGVSNDIVIDGMSGFVFINKSGSLHKPCTINRTINRIRMNYNAEETVNAENEGRKPILIPYFTCHHLRHTFCARLCEYESNVKVIQALMGHRDIKTTMDIYGEITEKRKIESIHNLSQNLNIF